MELIPVQLAKNLVNIFIPKKLRHVIIFLKNFYRILQDFRISQWLTLTTKEDSAFNLSLRRPFFLRANGQAIDNFLAFYVLQGGSLVRDLRRC
ncbi:unnamed protein product [Rhizophagus irregularis]|uniref:Uncharacterized protein n=1 Tax=Rhizophagus irregularis TaxID=588596 RepID=A0A915ZMS3_9GLOM|nr:unnamed protein product [Rhizophagus irregularis]CAB5369736.1 unnamed protein product [Rhizophagus irregularis]CAB5383722.1 unnamed protein product [Rhizophagus irregularis]